MINNVLEEIKRIKNERFKHTNDPLNLTSKPYSMNNDKIATATTKYYTDIKGENAKKYHFHNSSYTDSLRKETKHHFTEHKDKQNNDYLDKLYGVSPHIKITNNDNTLYYEKKLGQNSEFDYAINNMSKEIGTYRSDYDEGLQQVMKELKKKKTSPQPPIAHKAPSVYVKPAVTKTHEPVTVSPAFAIDKKHILKEAQHKMDKIKKSEETRNNMSKLISDAKMTETIKNVLEAQQNDATNQIEKKTLTESLNKMNVTELKQLFKEENLPTPKGNKEEIIKQLVKYRKENKGKFTV